MGFLSDFAGGALGAFPNGLQFAQSVNQGRLANEKMEMERQSMADQKRLHDLQFSILSEDNEKVSPGDLARRITDNVPTQEELIRFYTSKADANGLVRRKDINEGYTYINNPEVASRLYPAIRAGFEQELAGLKSELANPKKSASGGFVKDPNLIRQQISTIQKKLENLNWANDAWVKQITFDEHVRSNKEHERIEWAKANRDRSGGGLTMAQWESINNRIMQEAQKEWEIVRKDLEKRSTAVLGHDSNGNPITEYRVLDTALDPKTRKPFQYQRKASSEEWNRIVDLKREETFRKVKEIMLQNMGLGDYARGSSVSVTGNYLKPGMTVALSIPEQMTGNKKDESKTKPKEALNTKTVKGYAPSGVEYTSNFGKRTIIPRWLSPIQSLGDQARAARRELNAGLINPDQYRERVFIIEKMGKKPFDQLLKEK